MSSKSRCLPPPSLPCLLALPALLPPHRILQVAHEQQVAATVEVVVDGLVVDGAQHGTRLGALVTGAEDELHQVVQHDVGVLAHDEVGGHLRGSIGENARASAAVGRGAGRVTRSKNTTQWLRCCAAVTGTNSKSTAATLEGDHFALALLQTGSSFVTPLGELTKAHAWFDDFTQQLSLP